MAPDCRRVVTQCVRGCIHVYLWPQTVGELLHGVCEDVYMYSCGCRVRWCYSCDMGCLYICWCRVRWCHSCGIGCLYICGCRVRWCYSCDIGCLYICGCRVRWCYNWPRSSRLVSSSTWCAVTYASPTTPGLYSMCMCRHTATCYDH